MQDKVPFPEPIASSWVSLDTIIFRLRVLPPSAFLLGEGGEGGGGGAGEGSMRGEDRKEGVSGRGERGGGGKGELGGHDLKSPLKRELENVAKYAPASHCAGYVGLFCSLVGLFCLYSRSLLTLVPTSGM